MTSQNSDDRMDLGGFMAKFVLNNPFKDNPTTEQSTTTCPTAVSAVAPTHVVTHVPPQVVHLSPVFSTTACANPTQVLRTSPASPSYPSPPVPRSKSPKSEFSESSSMADSQDVVLDSSSQASAEKSGQLHPKTGQLMDTPMGHVGSNAAYAAQLKHSRVSEMHAEVQKW